MDDGIFAVLVVGLRITFIVAVLLLVMQIDKAIEKR